MNDIELLKKLPDIDEDDFTVYVRSEDWIDPTLGDSPAALKSGQPCRVVICRCRAGRYLSITVRRVGKKKAADHLAVPPRSLLRESGYWPSDSPKPNKPPFLNTIQQIGKVIYRDVFGADEAAVPTQGLIIISGATGSCKSNVARALIHLYLENYSSGRVRGARDRKPHLITLEDPIEAEFLEEPEILSEAEPFRWYETVDYTPRQMREDGSAPSPVPVEQFENRVPTPLRAALRDGLRQTPALFYAGESRAGDDVRALLEFAQTGHLVITTTHAGSLTEAIGKVISAANATTAAERSSVARTLIAAVHLVRRTMENAVVIAPSIWRSTALGQMALTADGLSSIVPQQDRTRSCLGRTFMIGELCKEAGREVSQELKKFAAECDVEGI